MAEPENGGTRFTEVVTSEIGGMVRLFAPLMVRALRKQMQAEVVALKQLLEQQATAAVHALHNTTA